MRMLLFVFLAVFAVGCGAEPKRIADAWDPDPDSFRYVIHERVDGEWRMGFMTNDPSQAVCPYPTPWGGTVTAIKIEDKRGGEKILDCRD